VIRRVLVALDASPRAPRVLEAAVEIASRFGAEVVPFRAFTIPAVFPPAAPASAADPLPAYLHAAAVAELDELVRNTKDVTLREPVVRSGEAWSEILCAADELDVDLIVMGSHGYRGWDRVLGTNAAKVANHSRRNVLIVHERPPDGAV
jgi:nucleotide-binding universal stress UspA family protein